MDASAALIRSVYSIIAFFFKIKVFISSFSVYDLVASSEKFEDCSCLIFSL